MDMWHLRGGMQEMQQVTSVVSCSHSLRNNATYDISELLEYVGRSQRQSDEHAHGRIDMLVQALERLSGMSADLRGKVERMEDLLSKHEELHSNHKENADELRAKLDQVAKTTHQTISTDDEGRAHDGRSNSKEGIAEDIACAPGSDQASKSEVSAAANLEIEELLHKQLAEPLQQSLWEIGLVCGHYGQTLAEIAAALVLLMMLIGINVIICIILLRDFSGDGLSVPAARKWREEIGHWSEKASRDGISMVHQMCQGDQALELSASQASQFQSAVAYDTNYIDISLGIILCYWCVMIFFFVMWEEVVKALNRSVTLLHLDRKAVTAIMPSVDGFTVCSVSRRRLFGSLMLCAMRIVVALVFLYSGSLWLVFTEDIQNLILNSVALVFVLDIDELVYRIACPASIQAMVDNIAPLKKPSVGPLHLPSHAISTLSGAALVLVLAGTLFLMPFADDVFAIKNAYCGGDTNFVVATNPTTGIVFAYNHIAVSQANASKLMADVVRQLRDGKHETNHITSPSYHAFEASVTSTLVENVARFGGQCSDIQPNDPDEIKTAGPLLAAMKDRIGISAVGVTNCSQLNFGQCAMDHPIIRLACPVTCGCSSAFNGNFLTSGCYLTKCEALPSFVSGRQSQPQCDIDPDVLPLVPEWLAYWRTFESHTPSNLDTVVMLGWHSQGVTRRLLVQKFHQFGCGAFGHFGTHALYASVAASIRVFFCSENQERTRRPLSMFCPYACACSRQATLNQPPYAFCPRTPPANASASDPIVCAGLYVRNASLLNNSLCEQGFFTKFGHPDGWYNCSRNAYNGKNVYTFDSANNVRWEIRWESSNHYEFGAYFLGQKIGLERTSKWTLSSVDQSRTRCRQSVRFFFSKFSTDLPSVGGWFPRNSSNTDVDCATGDMTTDGADRYFVQPAGSTALACPSGYAAISQIFNRPLFWDVDSDRAIKINEHTAAQCQAAARALGLTYEGTQTSTDEPGGCYATRAGSVWLNEIELINPSCSYCSCSHCFPICMKCEGSECQRLSTIFAASTSGLNVQALLRSSSTCTAVFSTTQACNMAATALALPDNNASVGNYVDSPHGCYYDTASEQFYFNNIGYGYCTALRNCVCQIQIQAVQWMAARSVHDPIWLGAAASRDACSTMCTNAKTATWGKTACAYQCNGCFVGSSLAIRSYAQHTQCFQYGVIIQAPYFTINPSTGGCPAGKQVYETKCASLNGTIIGGLSVNYNGSGNWSNPETCGCYFDQNGLVFFNSRTTDCNQADPGEIAICAKVRCAQEGTDPYSLQTFDGTCCPGSVKRLETWPHTSSVYCNSSNPNYTKSCWDMRWVCRTQAAVVCGSDSDLCLQQSPAWGSSYTCAGTTRYCTSWSKDMHRCCPNSCSVPPLCDVISCNAISYIKYHAGQGTCIYPNPALVQACFERNTMYQPDMVGQVRTREASVAECQTRCAGVNGCAHFSWWPDRDCHLQGNSSTAVSYGSATAGPAFCLQANVVGKYCSGIHQAEVANRFTQWTVGNCSKGSFVATFTYALASGNQRRNLLVNDVTVKSSVNFPASGSWSTWLDKDVTVNLVAGQNTIKLLGINSSNANFNSLTLKKATTTPTQTTTTNTTTTTKTVSSPM